MRAYLWVILIIAAMLGGYLALLPLTAWSGDRAGALTSGPF